MNNILKEEFYTGFLRRVAPLNDRKAAMFGLDARVALAIFGALSVITGSALYNALQEAKVVATITEMDNIDKALAEYLIDTGTYPVEADITDAGRLRLEELLISSITGWKGPYTLFSDTGTVTDGYLDHPSYDHIRSFRAINTSWKVPSIATKCLSTSESCSIYVCYINVPKDILKVLDVKIDGVDSQFTGKFRHNSLWGCKRGINYDKSLAPSS
ncbi:MAG: hypothetical protein GY804_13880 [Alphaproteobacteria bacterium]|nr:hypothetical protein [Alphaproteobacteria bacterium]